MIASAEVRSPNTGSRRGVRCEFIAFTSARAMVRIPPQPGSDHHHAIHIEELARRISIAGEGLNVQVENRVLHLSAATAIDSVRVARTFVEKLDSEVRVQPAR
jgi:hypothetical protein